MFEKIKLLVVSVINKELKDEDEGNYVIQDITQVWILNFWKMGQSYRHL